MVRADRAECDKLFIALKYDKAPTWSEQRMLDRIAELKDRDEDDVAALKGVNAKLYAKLVKAVDEDEEVDIAPADDPDDEPEEEDDADDEIDDEDDEEGGTEEEDDESDEEADDEDVDEDDAEEEEVDESPPVKKPAKAKPVAAVEINLNGALVEAVTVLSRAVIAFEKFVRDVPDVETEEEDDEPPAKPAKKKPAKAAAGKGKKKSGWKN